MLFESKDLLINQTRTPPKTSVEYKSFWETEKNKAKYGITIDGVFVPGFLYWHLNMYKTLMDINEGNGRIIRKLGCPSLRDNEWFLGGKINEADTFQLENGVYSKKGLCVLGARRVAKTVFQSSWIRYNSTLYSGTQNVIAGGNADDIKLIADEIDRYDAGCLPAFRQKRIENDWKKQITYGKKDAMGNREPYSYIPVRNFDGGKNTEAIAGLTPQSLVLDEIGKYPFLDGLKAALPALETDFGWRCVIFCMGTGGDMDNYHDAKELFDNPDKYNFLVCDIPNENRKGGVFFPGWMSYKKDFPKETKKLIEYLDIDAKSHPNLAKVDIKVSTKDKAIEAILKIRKSKDEDPKEKMYYPLDSREIFLTNTNNNFPKEACTKRKQWLLDNYKPEYVDFYRDANNKPSTRFSTLRPIDKYPVSPSDFKLAPVCVYEFPIDGLPYATYVMGIDPINEDQSSDSVNSLASFYVYKRMYDPLKGKFQNEMVASYAGRPEYLKDFHNLCLDVAEFYGAIILHENEDRTLTQFFIHKNKDYILYNSLELARRTSNDNFNKNTRTKGLSASTPHQRFGMTTITEDAKEPFYNNEDIELMGVWKIHDPMLLEEMIQYRGKDTSSRGVHDINCDRIISWYHTLILARHLDTEIPLKNVVLEKKEDRNKPKILEVNSPFFSLNRANNNSNKRKINKSPFMTFNK